MTPEQEDALVESSIADATIRTGAVSVNFDFRDAIRLAIRAAVAHERERAAKCCETLYPKAHTMASENSSFYSAQDQVVRDCAAAIRRGE